MLIKSSLLLFLLSRKISGFRLLYPQSPLNPKEADEPYQPEFLLAKEKGIACSLFDFDELVCSGSFRPRPKLNAGEAVLYRGWMMTPAQYQILCKKLNVKEVHPITSADDYRRCHHLLGWYKVCADLTAETHFFDTDDDIVAAAAKLDWDGFFVKDFVKSNTGSVGSIARKADNIPEIIQQLEFYRGDLEGGIALRKLEEYVEDTEQRYFVVNQNAYGSSDDVPPIVQTVAERVQAPFFSVDVIQTVQGDWRVVELGDGQVSDKKEWRLDRFVDLLSAMYDKLLS